MNDDKGKKAELAGNEDYEAKPNNTKPKSPLRYPGGKGKLFEFFREVIKVNRLVGSTYVEVFAGGAGIAVGLLLTGTVDKIVLNDLDSSIWAFWKSAIDRTEEFVDEVMAVPLTIDEWKRQRRIQQDPDSSTFDLGFSTFYLNRTNVSGILNGGVIGGLSQSGAYHMDVRFNRKSLADRIRQIAELGHRVEIYKYDAEEFIELVMPRLSMKKTLAYFDPPYYGVNQGLYTSSYEASDHKRLAEVISALKCKWCVSYNNIREVRKLYYGHRYKRFHLDYSLREKKKGSEIVFFSNNMKVPTQPIMPASRN